MRLGSHNKADVCATAPVANSSAFTRCVRARAFTLVEILIAIGILGMITAAIYSTWTAILRSSKVGLDAAASVQRTRIAVRNIEDSLVGVQSFVANRGYYGFVAENGSEPMLSFVARLPKSFPRSGKFEARFGDSDLRRVTFSLEGSSGYNRKKLVMRQNLLLSEWDEDEKVHPLVLARFVEDFKVEFRDQRGEWIDEWVQTNELPKLVRFTLKVADSERARRGSEEEIVRYVNIPSAAVQQMWQLGRPGAMGQPPGTGLPGALPGQSSVPGGLPGGGINNPGFIDNRPK